MDGRHQLGGWHAGYRLLHDARLAGFDSTPTAKKELILPDHRDRQHRQPLWIRHLSGRRVRPAGRSASSIPVRAVEGAGFGPVGLATFTDPGGAEPNLSDPFGTINDHYSIVSIDWGDTTPLDTSSGMISYSGSEGSATDPFTVSGSHTYGEEGTYAISVVIDHEGVDTTLTDFATVSDPAVVATGVPVFATACSPLVAVPIATFTDPGGAQPNLSDPTPGISSHYTVASIDWGDATPLDTTSGSISYSGSQSSKTDPFTVSGSHEYETEGTFTITTTINHEGVMTVVTSTAIVRDKLGFLLLDPTGSQSLVVSGNGLVNVTGDSAALVVDSSNAKAAVVSGTAWFRPGISTSPAVS